MHEQVKREVGELASLTYRKAFRNDAEGRRAVFRSLVQKLPGQLEGLLADYEEDLHPSQSINLLEDKSGITLDDDDSWMVRCYINSETPPNLDLQFFKRGWSKQSVKTVTLTLECEGKNAHVWALSKTEDVPSAGLAEFILKALLNQGIEVVKDEMG